LLVGCPGHGQSAFTVPPNETLISDRVLMAI
jgi:hypothetical protein